MNIQTKDGIILRNIPDGTPEADIKARIAKIRAERSGGNLSTGEKVARSAEFFGRGVVDAAANTLGAIPDLGTKAMRAVGLTEQDPDYYTKKIREGINATLKAIPHPTVGGPQTPTGSAEKFSYGAGKGVGEAASVVIPAAGISKLAKVGPVVQGASKMLATQPAMQATASAVGGGVTEATDNPLLGLGAALATPAVAGAARRIITPAKQLSSEARRLANVLAKEGVPIRGAQATDSKVVRALDAATGNLPISSSLRASDVAKQQTAYNAAVLKRAGINADKATTQVMAQGYDDLAENFGRLAGKTAVRVTDEMKDKLDDIAKNYGKKLNTGQKPILENYVNDLKNVDNLSGEAYKVNRSDIAKRAFTESKSDPTLSEALHKVTDLLDDAVEGALPADDLKGAWRSLRRKYANYKIIEKAIANTSEAAVEGDISPARLGSAIKQQSMSKFVRGKGDLTDLAAAGRKFITEKTPTSGTSERAWATSAVSAAPALGALIFSNPVLAAAIAAGQFGAPPAVYKALNNPATRKYMMNQLLSYKPQMTAPVVSGILATRGRDPEAYGLLDQ